MSGDAGSWRGDEAALRRHLSILAAAVRVEAFGNDYYLKMSECVRDKEGKIILESLAQDEVQHRAWLERQIDRIFPGRKVEDIEAATDYDLVPKKVFVPPKDGCLALEDEIKGLETAIEVEKRSARMYEEVSQEVADPELKGVLQRLARWERGHQKILEDNLHYLKRGGSWYGYTPILDG